MDKNLVGSLLNFIIFGVDIQLIYSSSYEFHKKKPIIFSFYFI